MCDSWSQDVCVQSSASTRAAGSNFEQGVLWKIIFIFFGQKTYKPIGLFKNKYIKIHYFIVIYTSVSAHSQGLKHRHHQFSDEYLVSFLDITLIPHYSKTVWDI